MIFTQDRVSFAVAVGAGSDIRCSLEMRVVTIHTGTKSGPLSTSAWSSGETDMPVKSVSHRFRGHLILCGWMSVLRERVWMERGILENPSVKKMGQKRRIHRGNWEGGLVR